MTRLPILSAFAFALIGAGAGLSPASAQPVGSSSSLIYGGPRYDPPPPRCVCVRAPCYCAGYDWGDLRHPAPPIAPPGFPPRRPPVWPPAPR